MCARGRIRKLTKTKKPQLHLNKDVATMILLHLQHPRDLARFGRVCKASFSAFKTQQIQKHAGYRCMIEYWKDHCQDMDKVPVDWQTEEVCLASIKQDTLNFAKIAAHKKTEAIFIEYLKWNPQYFSMVPPNKVTERMARVAVKRHANNIKYLPSKLKTRAVCLAALKSSDGLFSDFLSFVPEDVLDFEFTTALIEKHPEFALYLSSDMLTESALEHFMEKNAAVIPYILKSCWTPKLCLLALKKDPACAKHLPASAFE